ncbi:hypothetical protein D9M68_633540 [compost metagenome]
MLLPLRQFGEARHRVLGQQRRRRLQRFATGVFEQQPLLAAVLFVAAAGHQAAAFQAVEHARKRRLGQAHALGQLAGGDLHLHLQHLQDQQLQRR